MIKEAGWRFIEEATRYLFGPKKPEKVVIGRVPANIEAMSNGAGRRERFLTEQGDPMEILVGSRLINTAVALQAGAKPPGFIQILQIFANSPARHALSDDRSNIIIQGGTLNSDKSPKQTAFHSDQTFVSATTVEEGHTDYQGDAVTTSVWYRDPFDIELDGMSMHCFAENVVSVQREDSEGNMMDFQCEMRVTGHTYEIFYRSGNFRTPGNIMIVSMPQARVFDIQTGAEIFLPEGAGV